MNEKSATEIKYSTFDSSLNRAYTLLNNGQANESKKIIEYLIISIKNSSNKLYEAKSYLCLAHCERMLSNYRNSQKASQIAAQLFHIQDDVPGEIMALTTQVFVSVNLGHIEESVENALLAVKLSNLLKNAEHSILSYTALGVAYLGSNNFDKSNFALSKAIEIALEQTPVISTFYPRLNQWWVKVFKIFHTRYLEQSFPESKSIEECRELLLVLIDDRVQINKIDNQSNASTEAILTFGMSLDACWHGEYEKAQFYLELLEKLSQKHEALTWLLVLESWIRVEIAWLHKSWEEAIYQVKKMINIAIKVEHEQLACLGFLLESQLWAAQNFNEQALNSLRNLRIREQLIRNDCLETRAKIVAWQVGLRIQKNSIEKLERNSRDMEKLSLEDALTKLPNRRQYENYARKILKDGLNANQPPCLALIDVNSFKAINDNYSHHVGDEVLKQIANILISHVRGSDMAARLGGDEFIIFFKTSNLDIAIQICHRIKIAVRDYNWSTISDGLKSSISIGVSKAINGDTLETLALRSDGEMYKDKQSKPIY